MTREQFLARLRAGLAGLPPIVIDEIITDHDAHFAEGLAAGRSEAEVAAALGDPGRLARELRAEAGLKRWRAERSPSSAAAAVFAVLGLGAIDILFLLPLLMGLCGALFGLFVAVIAGLFGGGALFVWGPFYTGPGGAPAAMLAGLGVMGAAASFGALLTLAAVGLVNALVWYGRLHYRLLQPAIES